MSLLDALIYGLRDVFDSGDNALPRRSRVKFDGTVTDDPSNDRLVVTVGSGGGSGDAHFKKNNVVTTNNTPTTIAVNVPTGPDTLRIVHLVATSSGGSASWSWSEQPTGVLLITQDFAGGDFSSTWTAVWTGGTTIA